MKAYSTLIALICCLIGCATAQARTWTGTDGKKIEAFYLSSAKGTVTLILKNAKELTIERNKFIAEDQKYIEDIELTLEIPALEDPASPWCKTIKQPTKKRDTKDWKYGI